MKWIATRARKPIGDQWVIVYCDGEVYPAYWRDQRGFLDLDDDDRGRTLNPTHWMPMPDPPNGDSIATGNAT